MTGIIPMPSLLVCSVVQVTLEKASWIRHLDEVFEMRVSDVI